MKKIIGLSLSIVTAFTLIACSDDSETSTSPENLEQGFVPESSSHILPNDTSIIPLSSEGLLESSSSIDVITSSETIACTDGEPFEVIADSNGFADIGDVYKSIKCDEKVVFVVRHAEREAQISRESALTEEGTQQALDVGAKLIGNEDFVFTHTDYIRTESTCLNIAIGRGQQSFVHDTNDVYQLDWYIKSPEKHDEHSNEEGYNVRRFVARYAFLGEYDDTFYDLKERSEEMINTYLVKPFNEMPRFRIVCSHDVFVVPLVTYLTNGAINYRIYDMTLIPTPGWAGYVSGAAIIVNSRGERRSYAIKGLKDGFGF